MKIVLPTLLTYMTAASNPPGPSSSSSTTTTTTVPSKRLLPKGFTPDSQNMHDFYWGLHLKRVGVKVKPVDGWTALPVEVASGVVPCHQTYRSMALSNQVFVVGQSPSGTTSSPPTTSKIDP